MPARKPARRTTKPDPSAAVDGPLQPAVSRVECGILIAGLLLAAVLRCALPTNVSVEHFDEGVYASNVWFEGDEAFPGRHFYAPPMWPFVLQLSQEVFGSNRVGQMLPGVLTGWLTVVLVFFVTRRWFGPVAGSAAMILAATSDMHIQYSRTALTEPLLCLCWLAAVAAFERLLTTGRLRWAVLAGLCTGAAWATKYNGWLPAGIGCGATVLAGRLWPRSVAGSTRWTGLLVAVVVAGCVWFPVWFDLGRVGGYAAIQQHQAGYFVGLGGWFDSAWRQFRNWHFLQSPLGPLGMLPAMLSAYVAHRYTAEATHSRGLPAVAAAVFCAGVAAITSAECVLAIMTTAFLLFGLFTRESETRGIVAFWLLLVWFGGMLIATPFYTAYPRLTLPGVMTCWIGGGACISWCWNCVTLSSASATDTPASSRPQRATVSAVFATVIGIVMLCFGGQRLVTKTPPAWEDRSGPARAAESFQPRIREIAGNNALVGVYADPAVYFHLNRVGIQNTVVVDQSILRAPAPADGTLFLAIGLQAERSAEFQAQWRLQQHRWVEVERLGYRPSTIVRLNHECPKWNSDFTHSGGTMTLYRLRTSPSR